MGLAQFWVFGLVVVDNPLRKLITIIRITLQRIDIIINLSIRYLNIVAGVTKTFNYNINP